MNDGIRGMKNTIGAEKWRGDLVCSECGKFIRSANKIGSYIQFGCFGDIYVCGCGNVVQVTNYNYLEKEVI